MFAWLLILPLFLPLLLYVPHIHAVILSRVIQLLRLRLSYLQNLLLFNTLPKTTNWVV